MGGGEGGRATITRYGPIKGGLSLELTPIFVEVSLKYTTSPTLYGYSRTFKS